MWIFFWTECANSTLHFGKPLSVTALVHSQVFSTEMYDLEPTVCVQIIKSTEGTIGCPEKSPLWQIPVPSAQECTVTRRHGNLLRYFVLHYFYLSYVNLGSWTAVLPPYRLSGGLQFQWPASTLGLVWLKQTGSGLCEAVRRAIVVEVPIRHL